MKSAFVTATLTRHTFCTTTDKFCNIRRSPCWRGNGNRLRHGLPSFQMTAHVPIQKWEGAEINTNRALQLIKFNDQGLVPGVAQQYDTGEVLMLAWMNADSIVKTLQHGRAVYYSRSRKELWCKGETSGQVQILKDLRVDCDGDSILLLVDQKGVACHTGRRSCFYRAVRPPLGAVTEVHKVEIRPEELYKEGRKNNKMK